MDRCKHSVALRQRRKRRVRGKISGDAERPRLSVFRSARHMYAQLIDDSTGSTIVAASTLSKALGSGSPQNGNIAAASKVGESIARKALDIGVRQVRFDRAGYKYHGRVKALADAARKAGLTF